MFSRLVSANLLRKRVTARMRCRHDGLHVNEFFQLRAFRFGVLRWKELERTRVLDLVHN